MRISIKAEIASIPCIGLGNQTANVHRYNGKGQEIMQLSHSASLISYIIHTSRGSNETPFVCDNRSIIVLGRLSTDQEPGGN